MSDCRHCPDFFDCPLAVTGTVRPLSTKPEPKVKTEIIAAGHCDRNGNPITDFLRVLITVK